VFVPALSFVATANAVAYCGASPHFIDVEEGTLGMSPIALRDRLVEVAEIRDGKTYNKVTGNAIRAIVPMHTFGHPCDLAAIQLVADEFSLVIVEDAAEALGSFYNGRHVGTFGELGVLSFNGNKIITTGGGGAVITDDPELANRVRHLSTTARVKHGWEFDHDEVGYNYRMPNLNAALGCAQLGRLAGYLESKRNLYKEYSRAFETVVGVDVYCEPREAKSNYWLQAIVLSEEKSHYRDEILELTNDSGIMTRPAWNLLSTLPPFRQAPASPLKVSESLVRRIINVPSSPLRST
jgi:dTDP-4-amino-4,6-dideoxygalactose transaminase